MLSPWEGTRGPEEPDPIISWGLISWHRERTPHHVATWVISLLWPHLLHSSTEALGGWMVCPSPREGMTGLLNPPRTGV